MVRMNKNVFSQLAAEFEKMEQTINYQRKVIATMQKPPVCPCYKVPADGRICVVPDLPKMKLEDCSWKEIAMYAESGMADKVFALGDTKKVPLTNGTTITVRIIGFYHDVDSDGNTLPITFETVETLNDDYVMNDEWTNKGGWEASKLRRVLNEEISTLLPYTLKAVIRSCTKQTGLGGNSKKIGLTSDPLFILSEQEIFGRKIYSIGGEGKWYDWYRQENTEYGKCKQNGERDWRWERSPYSDNAGYFCSVYDSGDADYDYASGSGGVSFGFCV